MSRSLSASQLQAPIDPVEDRYRRVRVCRDCGKEVETRSTCAESYEVCTFCDIIDPTTKEVVYDENDELVDAS